MSTITSNIDLALHHLNQGDIVAIPTETVYGLAANAENEQAIKKIYSLKNRPLNHPLIMHVAEGWNLSQWVSFIPNYVELLIKQFWPGPLTLVLPSKPSRVSPLITGGQNTLAIRCPSHPVAQTLLKQAGFPLVAPSANPFGKISPTTAQHVQDSFYQNELLILDGGRCELGIESTIINATCAEGYEVLRPGLINEQDLQAVLSVQKIKGAEIRVPGKLASHYQPEKPLYCFANMEAIQTFCEQVNAPVYVLSFAPQAPFAGSLFYQFPDSAKKAAYELYYQLRKADQSEAAFIALQLPPDKEEWQGFRERVLKARYAPIR